MHSIVHIQFVAKKYLEALKGAEQHIEFESNEIKLDIPEKGINLEDGWKVIPLATPCVVSCPVMYCGLCFITTQNPNAD